jgi:HK97 family phage major capsid protein
MNHFKERIEEAQKAAAGFRTDVAELIGMAEAESRDLSDSESLQLEELAKSIEQADKRTTDLERAEKAMAERVVEKQAPAIIRNQPLADRPKGDLLFKEATARYVAHVKRLPLDAAVKECYPNDRALEAVVKSTINPADTTTSGWATELTQDANQGYLDLLRGVSVTAGLWAVAGINLQFDGYTSLKIPSRAGTDVDLASGWTGEGQAIPVRKATFGTQTISPYKWAAITTMTKEIMARSMPAIEQLVRNGMLQDTGTKLDNDYLGEAAAVAGYSPRGIFQGVTGTAAATGGATVGDDMLADLKALINPFYAANMGGSALRILMHPSNALAMGLVLYNGTYLFRDELSRGTIMGIPVLQSTNIAVDEILAVDMAQQAIANGPITFEVSDSATIVEVSDDGVAPAMGTGAVRNPSGQVGGATGAGSTTPVSNVRSLFQTETVAIKMVQYLSWAELRSGSTNRITGVDY